MVTLIDHYEDLALFFVEFLGVRTLTLGMIYDELIRLGSSPTTSIPNTRDKIMAMNSYMIDMDASTYPDQKNMIKAKVLPIRDPDGSVKLASADSDFIIVDRMHLGAIFSAKVQTLDFDFDATCCLRPFIEWLGLDQKYLSSQIREITRVDEEDKQPLGKKDREREIYLRAHALYRSVIIINRGNLPLI